MYTLTPLIDIKIKKFIEKENLIFNLVEIFGSPLNIVFPQMVEKNFNRLKKVFEENLVSFKIFFAHKPTRTFAFVKKIKEIGGFIDVSSLRELENALRAGFKGKEIIANGPKSYQFLEKLIESKATIVIDSYNEFLKINEIVERKKLKEKIDIIFRFSSHFDEYANSIFYERIDKFGMIKEEIYEIIKNFILKKSIFNLIGFSFHLNFDNYQKKISMLKTVLKNIIEVKELFGIDLKVVDIGGGYKTNFLKSKEEWDNFLLEFKKYVIGENKENLSFNGSKYGYYLKDNRLKGDYTFQSFYLEDTGEKVLTNLLNESFFEFDNILIKKFFQDLDLEIWIEPGKYLLDQAGITIMKIIDIKTRNQENILFVEGNFTNLWSDKYELFIDPFLLKRNRLENQMEKKGYFISGNLCLDIDMIFNHKVFLPRVDVGDLLIFPNTASYRMDFVSAQPISQPLPKKLVFENIDDIKNYYLEE